MREQWSAISYLVNFVSSKMSVLIAIMQIDGRGEDGSEHKYTKLVGL